MQERHTGASRILGTSAGSPANLPVQTMHVSVSIALPSFHASGCFRFNLIWTWRIVPLAFAASYSCGST